MIVSINHFSYTVYNLEKAIIFYRDILGLSLMNVSSRDSAFSRDITGISDAVIRVAYFKAENCCIELIQYIQGQGEGIDVSTCNPGASHICFNVQKFDDYVERLKVNGVKLKGKICVVPAGPNKERKVAYFGDMDYNTIEIIEL